MAPSWVAAPLAFIDWKDSRPETEFNFMFHRQAANKIVGISDATELFLGGSF
jgi:hypothetical protein